MKKIKLLFLLFLIVGTIFLNYKVLISSQYGGFMISDYNSNNFLLPFEVVINVDDKFPTLSNTTIPIKSLKARYYQQNDSIKKAIELYHLSMKENPYLKQPEAELAKLYFDLEVYDSSYYYALNSFKSLPNNNVHRDIYFRNLVNRNDTIELRSAFNQLRNYNDPNHWIDYAISRYNIVGPGDDESLSIMKNEFIDLYPIYKDDQKYKTLLTMLQIGEANISTSVIFSEAGYNFFNEQNYTAAIDHYEMAIKYDDSDYTFYENAGMAHNMQGNHEKASKYFDKVIYEFKPGNGKAEYLKGLMMIKLDSISLGCNYLQKAALMKFSGESSMDVYNRFCN